MRFRYVRTVRSVIPSGATPLSVWRSSSYGLGRQFRAVRGIGGFFCKPSPSGRGWRACCIARRVRARFEPDASLPSPGASRLPSPGGRGLFLRNRSPRRYLYGGRMRSIISLMLLGGFLLAQTTSDHGVERYLTHISTDKPIYRIGEKVYVRGVILGANSHSPIAGPGLNRNASFEIKGPKGETVTSGFSPITDS